MCKGPKLFGIDFNGDGEVSFEESYLTYRIGEDIFNSNDDNDDDDVNDEDDSFDDFGDDNF